MQYPLYRTGLVVGLYDGRMGRKTSKSKAVAAWAPTLEDFVKDSKTVTWAKIAAKMDMTEGGVRHWRNGTREIKLSEFIALCKAAGVTPEQILADGSATDAKEEALSAKEQMMITLFRGLTPEQQRETVIETLAYVEANRQVQQRFLDKPLRTVSNEEVRAAFGDIPPIKPRRLAREKAKPRRDPSTPLDDYPEGPP